MDLIFGAGQLDRRVAGVEGLLGDWREKERDFGQLYLEYEPTTPRDRVLVEDLAVTMLINSRVEARQAMGVFRNGATLDLRALPEKPLGETTDVERQLIAEVVGTMTRLARRRGREPLAVRRRRDRTALNACEGERHFALGRRPRRTAVGDHVPPIFGERAYRSGAFPAER